MPVIYDNNMKINTIIYFRRKIMLISAGSRYRFKILADSIIDTSLTGLGNLKRSSDAV